MPPTGVAAKSIEPYKADALSMGESTEAAKVETSAAMSTCDTSGNSRPYALGRAEVIITKEAITLQIATALLFIVIVSPRIPNSNPFLPQAISLDLRLHN
jgi:hypothetical protein